MTLGTAYLVFQYTRMLPQPLERINRQIQDLQRAAASAARVRELLATREEMRRLWSGELGAELSSERRRI
jgi:ABC-type multidrug transport system fused ATPase/permease subunit